MKLYLWKPSAAKPAAGGTALGGMFAVNVDRESCKGKTVLGAMLLRLVCKDSALSLRTAKACEVPTTGFGSYALQDRLVVNEAVGAAHALRAGHGSTPGSTHLTLAKFTAEKYFFQDRFIPTGLFAPRIHASF